MRDSVVRRVARFAALAQVRARLLSYTQVEESCRLLGDRLARALPPSWRRGCRLQPLPRGGLAVAGLLSYALDLQPDQLAGTRSNASEPVLLVDDCALSGARLRQTLGRLSAREVVIATLYSPPPLREAVRAAEPRIRDFVSAHDLKDLAPERHSNPEERQAWRQRWMERRPDAYWIGLPELVAFPWGEPDHPVWDAETGTLEDEWRLFPPDRCLKNWARLGLPHRPGCVRSYASAPGVAFSIRPESVLLCRIEDGAVFQLEGVAADMWRALAGYGDQEAVQGHLAEIYATEQASLQRDLDRFLAELLELRLILPT